MTHHGNELGRARHTAAAPPRGLTRRHVVGGTLGIAGVAATGAGLARPGGGLADLVAMAAQGETDDTWLPVIDEVESENGLLFLRLVPTADTTRGEGALGYAWTQSMDPAAPLNDARTVGPTLRLRRGDRLRIRLENMLTEDTNLHVHGLHVWPSRNSDNIFLHIHQFDHGGPYDLEYQIPDDHRSGLFWYHPHLHGKTAVQVQKGLVGAIILEETERDAADARDEPPVARDLPERLIVLQHLISVPGIDQFHLNGALQPAIQFVPGQRERWRILNASSDDFLNLYLDGLKFHRVAVDGNWLERAEPLTILPLGPAERAEVLIDWGDEDSYTLSAFKPLVRPVFEPPPAMADVVPLATLVAPAAALADATPSPALEPPGALLELEDLRLRGPVPTRDLDFQFIPPDIFLIDNKGFHSGRVDQTVELGGLEEWTIKNSTFPSLGWHPLHIHVNDFQVLSITVNGTDTKLDPVWYTDTVPLPTNGQVKIRAVFPDFTGRFVYHCHFLLHEDAGMMGVIDVAQPVRISGSALIPATASATAGPAVDHVVNSGTTVVWTNLEHDACRIVSVTDNLLSGEALFASGTLALGESFAHTFEAPGVFRYHCVSNENPNLSGTVRVAAEQPIDIVDGAFYPKDVTVAAGSTVTWTNRDSTPHTATADLLDASGAPVFDTGQLGHRVARGHTFTTPGDYSYHSTLDPTMTGSVKVRPVTRQSVSLALGDDELELPDHIEVFKDSTVTWANRGDVAWRVNVDVAGEKSSGLLDPERLFGSGLALSPGQRFMYTFSVPGTVSYKAFSDGTDEGTAPDYNVKVLQPVQLVAYGAFAFEPNEISSLPTGAEVVWINRDTVDHTVVVHAVDAVDGEPVFDTGPFGPGAFRRFPFATAGSFIWRTTAHPDVAGTIIVKDPPAL
jgi:FtsP/CotA-like multicopper oxidase with cupredoxin domain